MMNYPIPQPKKIEFTGGFVAAAFETKACAPVFAPALAVFVEYARRAFGELPASQNRLVLAQEAGLGAGYRISVGNEIRLTAADSTGMNHAFATLLQLIERRDGKLFLPECEIEDAPDSEWRGVMLDVVRRYHNPKYLFAVADLCWFYKLNRFQLHLTADQGVRFPFKSVPKAVSEEYYTEEELTELNTYCKERGIVLVPELDMPGHFTAFAAAYPELFGVTDQEGTIQKIMCAHEPAFAALREMLAEIARVFPDSPWIHIGGDEAETHSWSTSPQTQGYCKDNGLTDAAALYAHCVARAAKTVLDMGRVPVVWEGFAEQYNDVIPKETLVFAWESYYQTAPSLLKGGFKIINASWKPLYIVHPRHSWAPEEVLKWEKNVWQNWWEKSLAYEHPITVQKESEILGGQICVWRDYMKEKYEYAPLSDMLRDEFSFICDRVPALAEKTWTSYCTSDAAEFEKRREDLYPLLKQLFRA